MKLDSKQIAKLIPQRYPILMVDTAEILDSNRAIGRKAVAGNEAFFQGHFPGHPIMPGVLIVEGMGQTICVLLGQRYSDKLGLFVGLDKVKFRKSVVPGDLLFMEVEVLSIKHSMGKAIGKAYVDKVLVAEAQLKFMLLEKPQ